MSRTLTDSRRASGSARLSQFLKIARANFPHHSTRALVARLRERADARVGAYARIARGRET